MSIKGVDLSRWQDGLKISAVRESGYKFAILRGGYTGYGDRSLNKDTSFEGFYEQAKKIGFPVGCYWYSCADSKEFGLKEAKFIYKQCLKGKKFEYPIYIDVEEERWQSKDKKGVTEAIIAFCEYLESKGYYVGVYASLDWFNNEIDTARLNSYSKWVACWQSRKPMFKFNDFDMWQNSDKGKAGGVRVDTDIAYVDFPKIMKEHGFNGYTKTKLKSIDQVAKEVIDGKWGNGSERRDRLTKAGYDYATIQKRVNELLK